MKLPLQITFRNMDASEFVEAAIREKAEKLEHFFSDIMSCRVVVESLHKHHQHGNLYNVHIDVKVAGKEIAVSREAGLDHAHEDIYVAIRDAFNAIQRRLQDHSAKIQQQVKTHEVFPHGIITELNPEEDYGIIQGSDGRYIYFHRHSLLNADLDDLSVGASVRFNEERGEKGPQASSVTVEGKHHVVA